VNLTYLEEARRELLDSVAYYNACAEGLGHEFYFEVQAGEDAILRMPEAWGRVAGGYRRKLLRRFPYGLVYHAISDDTLEIVAVMHLHREPDYWRGRGETPK
jgi:hypothetical protein